MDTKDCIACNVLEKQHGEGISSRYYGIAIIAIQGLILFEKIMFSNSGVQHYEETPAKRKG